MPQPDPLPASHCHYGLHGPYIKCSREIENLVPNRRAQPRLRFMRYAKAAERQILDREIGFWIVGRHNPALESRIVRPVGHMSNLQPYGFTFSLEQKNGEETQTQ